MENTTVVLDNGSYNVKMGFSTVASPLVLPNCLMRTKDKKLFLADQIDNIQDISQVHIRRPQEKGQLTSWDLQKAIWDRGFERIFDIDGVQSTSDCNLLLTETMFQLPQLSRATDQIVFEEYEFKRYYKTSPMSLVPWNVEDNNLLLGDASNAIDALKQKYNDFQLVIDSGFNCTWIVPMIQGLVYWPGVKKLNIGGRALTGLLREMISFRYYDVTEETILVNNIKENACFVAKDYSATIAQISQARRGGITSGEDKLILEYVLPDFKTTTKGFLLTEEKKKTLNMADLQLLKLYDERICIPELMFHPEIGSLEGKPGLVSSIIASIGACPELVQPLLASNIILTGGTFKIPGFKDRLMKDLKANLPQEWNIRLGLDEENVAEYSWRSGCEFVNKGGFEKVCITREEYLEQGANVFRRKFQAPSASELADLLR